MSESSRSPEPTPVATLPGYDLWSLHYDSFANPLVAMVEQALEAEPLAVAGRRVVELGCGTGRNAARVIDPGAASYIGVDGSAGMLSIARSQIRDPRVAWIRAELQAPLPLADTCCDLVLIALVLEHIPTLTPLFCEVGRILRPGGSVRILEIHAGLVTAGTQAHFQHAGRELRFTSYPHPAAELDASLREAGFQVSALASHAPTGETLKRLPKLSKHAGRPVLTDMHALKAA